MACSLHKRIKCLWLKSTDTLLPCCCHSISLTFSVYVTTSKILYTTSAINIGLHYVTVTHYSIADAVSNCDATPYKTLQNHCSKIMRPNTQYWLTRDYLFSVGMTMLLQVRD